MERESGGSDLDQFIKFRNALEPNFAELKGEIKSIFHKEMNRLLLWLVVALLGSMGGVWYASEKYTRLQDAVEKELPTQIKALQTSNEELKQSIVDLRRLANELKERLPISPRSDAEIPSAPRPESE